ncbi:hypothetical protein FHR99_001078 [Litorivivens lipolytica]|uniref:Uncharacterized protein n=1 Tax=Litorivivens lipolytica TaxID=1524264 RepID=A0A7W4W4Q2_9GAMM|nr:hypothetical protein [Litorivivens lipolytica]MBB3046842.1 hypothetical protein [Litorivivens lipolytica]
MRFCIAVFLGAVLVVPNFSVARERLTIDTNIARDSDRAKHDSYYLKYRYDRGTRESPSYWGFGVGSRQIRDRQGESTYSGVAVEMQQPLNQAVVLRAQAAKLLDTDWSPWTGSTALVITPNPRLYAEVFAERDIVDTTRAIEQNLWVKTFGISSDYKLHPELTLVGAFFGQRFSDHNSRTGKVARMLWEVTSVPWFMAELRYKVLTAEFNGDGYFSPDRLTESLALVTFRGTIFEESHALSLQLGAGKQEVNREFSQDLYLAEFKARGWFTDSVGHELTLGCKNTGDVSFAAQASDYRYCYSRLQLHKVW